jgi:hypothetical protein
MHSCLSMRSLGWLTTTTRINNCNAGSLRLFDPAFGRSTCGGGHLRLCFPCIGCFDPMLGLMAPHTPVGSRWWGNDVTCTQRHCRSCVCPRWYARPGCQGYTGVRSNRFLL